MGEFNAPLLPLDRNTRHKLNKKPKELTEVMAQLYLTDNHRTFHQNTKQFTFFTLPHGTFSKIDHILGNIANLNRYKKWK